MPELVIISEHAEIYVFKTIVFWSVLYTISLFLVSIIAFKSRNSVFISAGPFKVFSSNYSGNAVLIYMLLFIVIWSEFKVLTR